jgi:hypothetical protein
MHSVEPDAKNIVHYCKLSPSKPGNTGVAESGLSRVEFFASELLKIQRSYFRNLRRQNAPMLLCNHI